MEETRADVEERARISQATAFDAGDEFGCMAEVLAYFTVDEMRAMFGETILTQDDLDAMAEAVIGHRWHCAF